MQTTTITNCIAGRGSMRQRAPAGQRMWRAWRAACCAAAMLLAAGISLAAATPPPATAPSAAATAGATDTDKVLRVGVSEVPPFVIRQPDGQWRGIAVDLWSRIAKQLGYRFEWVPMPFRELLPALRNNRLDLVVGALTMTAEREAVIDFTHPYYQTGLAIAVPADARGGVWSAIGQLLSPKFLMLMAGLAAMLLVVGALVWLAERRRNAEQFPPDARTGLGNGFWWAAVTMTTVGYGDRAPVTLAGRLLAIVWMFTALVVTSTFIAAVTSAITVNSLSGDIQGQADLHRANVATVSGTAGETYLRDAQIRRTVFDSVGKALDAVRGGTADAVVYDLPILQYRNMQRRDGKLHILPGTFDNQSYAFALRSGSAYREPVNEAILGVVNGNEWPALREAYVGRGPGS